MYKVLANLAMDFYSRNLLSSSLSLPSVITASLVSAAVLLPVPASASTIWNWSFQTNVADQSGSGTLTTDDVIPTAFTTYQATSINGTYNRGGLTYAITNLSDWLGADNTFQWDGTTASSIYATEGGIAFYLDNGSQVNFYSGNANAYKPVLYTASEFEGADGDITSSSLSPSLSPSVPGPLPLFGAAAAFSSSRRIRRRLAKHV